LFRRGGKRKEKKKAEEEGSGEELSVSALIAVCLHLISGVSA
jgi:hypothetical protein